MESILYPVKKEAYVEDFQMQSTKKAKVIWRNKQKHNETERKRRENLAQLFVELKKELQEDREAEGEDMLILENRNAVLEQTIALLKKLKVKAYMNGTSNNDQKTEPIPGLGQLTEYIESLRIQLSRKRKAHSISSPPSPPAQTLPNGQIQAFPQEFMSGVKMAKQEALIPTLPMKNEPKSPEIILTDLGKRMDPILTAKPPPLLHSDFPPELLSSPLQGTKDCMDELDFVVNTVTPPYSAILPSPSPDVYSDSSYTSSPDNHGFSDSPYSSSPDPFSIDYCAPTVSLYEDDSGDSMPSQTLPHQSTVGVDLSRLLFTFVVMFGLFYHWGSFGLFNYPGEVQALTSTARVLAETKQNTVPPPEGFFSYLTFAYLIAVEWLNWTPLSTCLVLLTIYILMLVMNEPVLAPSSYFYQQAGKEYRKAVRTEICKKHYLRALAFLQRPFPEKGLPLLIGIAFQSWRYFLHCIYIGVWIDKLLLIARDGEASNKKAADIYLCLMRNCSGTFRGFDLLYLSLCTINMSHLFDSLWVAETYAHVSFFIGYLKFRSFKILSSLYLQLAWRIAKKEKDSRFVWLLYATSHMNVRNGNWKDAEVYLTHILDKLLKFKHTIGDAPLLASAQTLLRYTHLTQANIELGKGNIAKALSLAKEVNRLCLMTEEKEHFRNGLKYTQRYGDIVCARFAMLLEVHCLIKLGLVKDAENLLLDLKIEQEEIPESIAHAAPVCVSERVSRLGMAAMASYRAGDKKKAIMEADLALSLAQMAQDDMETLFIWPASTSFIEVYLDVWEDVLTPTRVKLENEQAMDKSRNVDELLKTHLTKRVLEGIRIFKKKIRYLTVIGPRVYRFKGNYYFNTGNKKKALRNWEKSATLAHQLSMTYEEGKALLETGKHMMSTKCKCFNRKHSTSCPSYFLEQANALFVQCGAAFDSKNAIELIQSHYRISSLAVTIKPSVIVPSSSSQTLYAMMSSEDEV